MTTICQALYLVFVAKTARTFCYGFLGGLFPLYLSELGVSTAGVGTAVTLTLAGSAGLTRSTARRPRRDARQPRGRDGRDRAVPHARAGADRTRRGRPAAHGDPERLQPRGLRRGGGRRRAGRDASARAALPRLPRGRRRPVSRVLAPRRRRARPAASRDGTAPALGATHPAPRGARGARLVRGRLRPPVARRVLPPRALRARPRGARLGVRHDADPHGCLAPARAARRPALRAARDDGRVALRPRRWPEDRLRPPALPRLSTHQREARRVNSPAPARGGSFPRPVASGERLGRRANGGTAAAES